MTEPAGTTTQPDALHPRLQRRAFVGYCDMVESVRLYELHGPRLAELWEAAIEDLFGEAERHNILRVEGDALIFSADEAAEAADIALTLADRLSRQSIGGARGVIQLRSGLVEGPFWQGRHTLYGPAINLAARLAGIALPGEILVTEAVRIRLPARFDMRLTDRGDLFLKNVDGAVRAHALTSGVTASPLPLMVPDTALKLLVAVLPPRPMEQTGTAHPLAEAFADSIASELSSVRGFGVISRLSTRRLGHTLSPGPDAGDLLGAHYVLSGHCRFNADRFEGWLQLTDTRSGVVVWTGRAAGAIGDLFRADGIAAEITREIVGAVLQGEHQRATAQPLPSIENYTLLMAGVTLMHSLSEREFQRAHELLEALADRTSRTATPLAWLARWHNLRVLQGWSADPEKDAQAASDLCRRALDADPRNALAHVMLGMTMTHLNHRLDLAADSYEAAMDANPSEPLAWLLRGALRSFTDDPGNALGDVYQANALSPLDPQKYYYLTLTAGAHLTAGEDDRALDLATQSLRFNRNHLSSWRIKAVSEWRSGQAEAARETVAELLRRDPEFTVSRYLAAAPSADYRIGKDIAKCLREAGVPE